MIRLSKSPIVLVVLAIALGSLPADANLIVYNDGSANRYGVYVMEDTGENPVKVYSFPKFGGIPGNHTISPPQADGTSWVAIEFDGLSRVRADGEGLTRILCYEGTDINGSLYQLYGEPQWSPDGSEILVQTFNSLALIAADFEVGPDCISDLVPIYPYNWENGVGWILEGTAAWNGDGSRIAFFEYLWTGEVDDGVRLVILERGAGGWVVERTVDASHIEFFDGVPFALDWQRNGNLLAFQTRQFTGPHQSIVWINSIDAATGEWAVIAEGESPSWSPDDAELLFSDSRGELVKWTYPAGPGQILGSGIRPDWQRNALDLTCSVDADCDDDNVCTTDTCDAGLCVHAPSFAACDDGNECTTGDGCDANGSCSGTPLADGATCSAGSCCGGICTAPDCVYDADCNDGDICTIDSCSFDPVMACDASCAYEQSSDPACQCLPKGADCTSNDECCSGQCHPVKETCK